MTDSALTPYVITARVRCNEPSLIVRARTELSKLAEATLREPGCLAFTIHEEQETPGVFIMWELFTGNAAFEEHFTYPHTVAYADQQLTTLTEHWVSSPVATGSGGY